MSIGVVDMWVGGVMGRLVGVPDAHSHCRCRADIHGQPRDKPNEGAAEAVEGSGSAPTTE